MPSSPDEASAEQKYDSRAARIWTGNVDFVIDELSAYGRKFGEPLPGGETILRLCGEYLSDDKPLQAYWNRRPRHAPGTRAYRRQGDPVYN